MKSRLTDGPGPSPAQIGAAQHAAAEIVGVAPSNVRVVGFEPTAELPSPTDIMNLAVHLSLSADVRWISLLIDRETLTRLLVYASEYVKGLQESGVKLAPIVQPKPLVEVFADDDIADEDEEENDDDNDDDE